MCKHFLNYLREGKVMDKITTINALYFDQKKTLTEIAEIVNTSISYISRILRRNKRYKIEKEIRKQSNLQKRRTKQKEMIYNQRKNKIDIGYIDMKEQHNKDVLELSRQSHIGNEALRKWCSSAYLYNEEKDRYEFDSESLLKPADFPIYIKA